VKILKYAAAAIALVPGAAHAREANDIVVTASGVEQQRDETGQAITVIDRAALERTQTNVISDLLRTVPGVHVARNGGVGGVTSTFIRGGESSQTLVLIDGVRINDPSSPNAAFDFGSLLTGNVGRVEVLRGPNSVIWGSQAIGGVVNIQTLEPIEALAVNARAEYGYRNTAEAQANVSGTSGIASGSIGGGIGPVLLGALSDHFTRTAPTPGDGLAMAMGIASLLYLWAAVHYWLAVRHIRADLARPIGLES